MEKPTAILCRINAGLRIYEEALTAANIPYHLVGRSGYWAAEEIKACLSYLQCVYYPSDWALAGAIRSPFHPTKFLPKTKITARLKELQENKEPSYWHLLTKEPQSLVDPRNIDAVRNFTGFIHSLSRYKDLTASEAVKQTLAVLKAFDYYAEQESEIDNDPVMNLTVLTKQAARFSSLREFLDWTRKVTAASKTKKGVALSTIHRAKGMEWNRVFVVQCNDGILPHAKSTDTDSERNCLFVGLSRAERELTVSYSGAPSPFIKHLVKEKSDAVL